MILDVCLKHWSSQIKDIILASVINCYWTIWFCRNQYRYKNMKISTLHAINLIKAASNQSGTFSKGLMSNSIEEFRILKAFAVATHPSRASIINQID